jgi:hypothetical protein
MAKVTTKKKSENKFDIFDIINILNNKTREITDEELKEYNHWLIMSYYSYGIDSFGVADIANKLKRLSKRDSLNFFWYGIPKNRIRRNWVKRDKSLDEKISMVKEYYNYSDLRAREVISLIDQLDLWDTIKNGIYKGGVGKSVANK